MLAGPEEMWKLIFIWWGCVRIKPLLHMISGCFAQVAVFLLASLLARVTRSAGIRGETSPRLVTVMVATVVEGAQAEEAAGVEEEQVVAAAEPGVRIAKHARKGNVMTGLVLGRSLANRVKLWRLSP